MNMDSDEFKPNQFVQYLNTMLSIKGNNIAALAENQSTNIHFSLIEEEHPLSSIIYKDLLQKNNVIITGHAGDGKSTIALEVFKLISKIPLNHTLEKHLKIEESIGNIKLIKDLSEISNSVDLLDNIIDGEETYLLVTNTGALLDMFKGSKRKSYDTESRILKSLQKSKSNFDFANKSFIIYNIAKIDNFFLARNVFIKMLDEKNWKHCESCNRNEFCTILKNRQLLVQNDFRAVDRIFLIYKRLLAYGTRLTMRQIVEHLAWTITGGRTLCDIDDRHYNSTSHFYSHNLFFGNNGVASIIATQHIKAIESLNMQSFGFYLSPDLERILWSESAEFPDLGLTEDMMNDLAKLKKRGISPKSESSKLKNLDAAIARTAISRLIYFFGDYSNIDKDINYFLDSSFTRKWSLWTSNNSGPSENEKRLLINEIIFVLSEHLSGKKHFENNIDYIDITEHRDVVGLRQSVQILISRIYQPINFSSLVWEKSNNIDLNIPEYKLLLKYSQYKDFYLELDIAFLDYVRQRYCGVITNSLSRAFRQRIDNFKMSLINMSCNNKDNEELILVRSKTDSNTDILHCSLDTDNTIRVY